MPPSCGRRNSRLILALLLSLIPFAAAAETTLSGRIEQGGLALGRTEPGTSLTLDGRAVPVAEDGRFLLGFGRDAPLQAKLEIRSGQTAEIRVLQVAKRDWPIQKIEGLPRDKAEPDPAAVARIKAEADAARAIRLNPSPQPRFLDGLRRPADGVTSGVFGSQRVYNGNPGAPHSGLDIAAPKGAPVRAAADGTVVMAEPDLFLTGGTVMIDHGLGLVSSYAHLSRLDVTAGQAVRRDQPIGGIGATGLATGPHLHWGLSWLDVRLDPDSVLDALERR